MPYWKLYYHFIWGTKNRLPLIDAVLKPEIYRIVAAKAKELGGFVHAVGESKTMCILEFPFHQKLRQQNLSVM